MTPTLTQADLSPSCGPVLQASSRSEVQSPRPIQKHLSSHWNLVFCLENPKTPFMAARIAKKQRNWTCQLALPSPQCPWKRLLKAEGRPPLSPDSCCPFTLFTRGMKPYEQLLAPTLQKIRLNIAKCALMSQLRAGSAATFHFRKLGRNQFDLQQRSFLSCSCGFKRTIRKIQLDCGECWRFGQADNRACRKRNVPDMTSGASSLALLPIKG